MTAEFIEITIPEGHKRYGVLFDPQPEFIGHDKEMKYKPLMDKVFEILKPFYASGEASEFWPQMPLMLGVIGDRREDPLGLGFQCTRRAAQAVADALPGYTIVDHNNERILPQKAPKPPRGPTP